MAAEQLDFTLEGSDAHGDILPSNFHDVKAICPRPFRALRHDVLPRHRLSMDSYDCLLPGHDDWSRAVAAIEAPIMIVIDHADAVRTAHAVEFYGLLGGGHADGGYDGSHAPASKLAILPGLTHYAISSAPQLAATVLPFLAAPR
jgi:hypothetical protein